MSIAIVGKGAMGLLFANIIQENLGNDEVCFVMDDERFERHANDTYTINDKEVQFRDVRASEATPADIVILAVKSLGLAEALDIMEPLVGPETAIVPVLNGITSEEKCAERFGWEHVVGCVAIGMDAERYGESLIFSKPGRVALGALNPASVPAVERAFATFEQAGFVCTNEEDLRHTQWGKYMGNVGINQTCAAYGVVYRELFSDDTSEPYRTFVGAMREVIAIGNAEGITLTEADMNSYINLFRSLDPESKPSTAQDVANKALTEVDEFAGEVIRRAEKHGIEVPCNKFLLKRIREIEAAY